MARNGTYYYLLSSLPALGHLGQEAPMSLTDMLERVEAFPAPRAVVEAIAIGGDLLLRQAVGSGEITEPAPTVLTVDQLRDEAPLPEFLDITADTAQAFPLPEDLLWEVYYRHIAAIGKTLGCGFLSAWASFESGLRNALAIARATALELDASHYLVATDLADEPDLYNSTINEWASTREPLAALRCLDHARWQWIGQNEAWFSFSLDEVAAYTTQLMLVNRWHELAIAQQAAE